MRVVRVREFGPPQVMRIEEAEPPRPAAGQAVVAVEMAGAIYAETIVRSGRYPMPLPYEPGIEVGGRVVEVGPDVDPSLLGRRVVATTVGNTGGYAELALAEVDGVYPVPDGLPLERAIPVFQAGAVGIGILSAMRVQAGETVLITAAAGRVGSLLVQLAKAAGAHVIGAASSPGKLAVVADLGADVTVDYSTPDWVDQVREATGGRGAEVVLDAIGGAIGEQALQAAADGGGRIGVYGFASGTWLPLDVHQIVRRGLSVTGPLGIAFARPTADQRADALQALDAAAAGDLVPRVHAIHPLEQACDAHTDLEQRRTIGAVLLTP
ncbi:zinc-binding dehydrogenase [Actinoallomurus rhizosphaericola]|uniref:zinc-binding dehydrogenase n=1 Tax=Actinoallomurus rhizosphaericola TaxID=2952536 RepID=UPI002091F758|nr:zinc-binding dehydrogenase [Actinoallomurus rhizosphaericola]MCO5999168.1 zinc-binding dehydrogenase [Actinoallomurus rhizosphaericola]